MPATAASLAALQRLLEGSQWLGAELETSFRVLALTIEPAAAAPTGAAPDGDDRRLQVLLSPTGLLRACLRVDGETPRVESFDLEQLADVVAAMDAPVLTGQLVGAPAPTPEQWPADSLQGRSSAMDGHAHRLRFEVRSGSRSLGLFATFDDVLVQDATGSPVALP